MSRQTDLAQAVLAATTICPRIVNATVRAKYGRGDRARHLRDAIRHTRELLTRLECAELLLAGRDEDAELPTAEEVLGILKERA